MSQLRDNFGKKFIATGEASPPPGPNIKEFAHEVEVMKGFMDRIEGVNVVDIPGARMLMSSLGASIYMVQREVEPIFQMTVRDRNMLALQADLVSAAVFGIENVLSLAGDHPASAASDHPLAKPVYDLDSTSLIRCIKGMNEGRMLNGKEMNGKTNFFIGAAIAPGASPLEGEIYKTKRKLDAGCDFFQTQAVFDMKQMENFLDKYEKIIKEDIRDKVLVGLVPIRSHGMLKYLMSMPGIQVEAGLEKRIKDAKESGGDVRTVGVEVAAEIIDKSRELGMKGVHIMPVGDIEAFSALVKKL